MTIDKQFIAEMQDRLTKERDGLTAQLARIAKKDPKTPGDYDAQWPVYNTDERASEPGDEDAQESTDYANAIGVENVLELRLLAVERALRRIKDGTYGQCSNCEAQEEVAERLKADPAAERCLTCKQPV